MTQGLHQDLERKQPESLRGETMNTIKRFLLGTLLLVFFAGLYAVIEVKAIYPPTFHDNMLVEDGLLLTIHEHDVNNSTMKVYDAQNPAEPELLSTVTVPSCLPRNQHLYQSHVYIPNNHILYRYSLLDPESPVLNYEYADNMTSFSDMAFSGNYLFMATGIHGLRVINITNENSATAVGSFANADPLLRVWAHENRAAVLSRNADTHIAVLKLLDISNPATPVYTGMIELPNYTYNDRIEAVFDRDYLHLVRSGTTTKVYDLSVQGDPALLGNLESGITHSVILDGIRYSDSGGFFRVHDLADPLNPVEIANYEIAVSIGQRFVLDLPHVYLIRDNQYYKYSFCFDLNDLGLSENQVYSYDTGNDGNALAESQDWLYYRGAISQLDPLGNIALSEPSLELTGIWDIKVDEGIMHTLNPAHQGPSDCSLYSVADPANPVLLSTIAYGGLESFLFGEYFFIRGGYGMKCYDISDPANPVYLFTMPEYVSTVCMSGDYIWTIDNWALVTYRITDGQAVQICYFPQEFMSTSTFLPCLAKRGNYIYHSGLRNEIRIYDVSDPYATVYAGHAVLPMPYDAVERIPKFTQDGKMLVVTAKANQVVLYDLSDPGSPEYLLHHSLPYKIFRVVLHEDLYFFKSSNLIYCMQAPERVANSDPILIPAARLSAGPNPFSESVSLTIELSEIQSKSAQRPEIQIYNIRGQKLRTLGINHAGQGPHSVVWDGKDKSGTICSNGIYLARFMVDGHSKGSLKLSLIK